MDPEFDCIIVGGGIAGLAAAITLARARVPFLLVERGEFSGAKNVSGGVLWGPDLSRIVPEFWDDDRGYERCINHRRLTFLDGQSAMSVDFKSSHFDAPPPNGVSVLRSKFDNWLAGKVQEAIDASSMSQSSLQATDVLVDELLVENGRVCGIRAGDDVFRCRSVIVAEGVNNLLTRQLGMQPAYVAADQVSLGVKEVIRFDRGVLEDRFQLSGRSGVANEFIGFASQGIAGGGFLYTNRESVSIGLVLGMTSLRGHQSRAYELLTAFKQHPVVADMLRGGQVDEYSAHVVSNGDVRGLPKEVYGNGFLIAGEAANLLVNSGRAIQGMDCAMRSGILAAETIVEARNRGDFTARSLKSYRDRLEGSFVLRDMRTFQNASFLLHDPVMYNRVPGFLCEFGRQYFTIDGEPTPKASRILRDCIRRHTSYWELIKLGWRALRAF